MLPEFSKFKQYDGCQGTVWQMRILLVDMLSPEVPAFKHPRHALRMAHRVPHQFHQVFPHKSLFIFLLTFPSYVSIVIL